jgi:uncharacterized protein YegP (UPF0339 family)
MVKITVFYAPTAVRKRERWGVRIQSGGNNKTLFISEKYVNHDDALKAAMLVKDGPVELVDEGSPEEYGAIGAPEAQ